MVGTALLHDHRPVISMPRLCRPSSCSVSRKADFPASALLSLPLMALCISRAGGGDHPADPDRAGRRQRLGLPAHMGLSQHRHPRAERVIGIFLGYYLAAQVSDAAVKLAVGADFCRVRGPAPHRRASEGPAGADARRRAARRVLGHVAGFTSMIAHAGGPPFQIYVMPQRLARDVFVGTGAIVFALINWLKVVPYIALGQFTPANLATSAALFPRGDRLHLGGRAARAARAGREVLHVRLFPPHPGRHQAVIGRSFTA